MRAGRRELAVEIHLQCIMGKAKMAANLASYEEQRTGIGFRHLDVASCQ